MRIDDFEGIAMTPHFRFLPLSGFIIGAALLVGCDDHSGQAQQPPSPQVVVHVVKSAPLVVIPPNCRAAPMRIVLQRFALR